MALQDGREAVDLGRLRGRQRGLSRRERPQLATLHPTGAPVAPVSLHVGAIATLHRLLFLNRNPCRAGYRSLR